VTGFYKMLAQIIWESRARPFRGRVIHAARRFEKRRLKARSLRQRRFISTSANLAVLSKPFIFSRGAVIPVRREVTKSEVGGSILIHPTLREKRAKEIVRDLSRSAGLRAGVGASRVSRAIVGRVLPRTVAWAAWKAAVCKERQERREVLLARRKAGSGVSNTGPRKFSESSKVRC
jgi:hypothetical protein